MINRPVPQRVPGQVRQRPARAHRALRVPVPQVRRAHHPRRELCLAAGPGRAGCAQDLVLGETDPWPARGGRLGGRGRVEQQAGCCCWHTAGQCGRCARALRKLCCRPGHPIEETAVVPCGQRGVLCARAILGHKRTGRRRGVSQVQAAKELLYAVTANVLLVRASSLIE